MYKLSNQISPLLITIIILILIMELEIEIVLEK